MFLLAKWGLQCLPPELVWSLAEGADVQQLARAECAKYILIYFVLQVQPEWFFLFQEKVSERYHIRLTAPRHWTSER